MKTLDVINRRMGRGTVFYGGTGIRREWAHIASRKSPAYTTDREQIMTVRVEAPDQVIPIISPQLGRALEAHGPGVVGLEGLGSTDAATTRPTRAPTAAKITAVSA